MSDLQELSLRMNAVLEMVGVTEEMRRLHRRRATLRELLITISAKRHYGRLCNVYQCGSSWEGTVTPDLASDVDIIMRGSNIPVVSCSRMVGPGDVLLTVRDEWTRPGYAKLQLMWDGQPVTVNDVPENDALGFDDQGRACYKHILLGTMHGPALMSINEQGRHYSDTVLALQCKGIPSFATDWISRPRQHDWPSQQLIDELKIMDCLLVGVGHFESREKELEWRLSFSLQERIMMKSLNITQHRVYVIMKMIKRDILEKQMNEESLSSYHCKTCVFYMAETTPASMWVPENLIDCLLQCLTLLLQWIRDKFCPSFFIKDSNLFDKEVFLRLSGPLERLIASLLHTGHQFLYDLQSDRVGEMLRGGDLMLYKPVADSSVDKYILDINQPVMSDIIGVFRISTRHNNSAQDSLSFCLSELEEFQNADSFSGYTEENYKYALDHALPWLHLSIGLEYAARAVTCPDRHEGNELMKNVDCHLQQAMNTDLVNVRLARATILLRQNKLKECLLLVQELENGWTYLVATDCTCTSRGVMVYQDEEQRCKIAAKCRQLSLRELMRINFASCVIFERSQIELVPSPLCYEMYRSLYTRISSRDDDNCDEEEEEVEEDDNEEEEEEEGEDCEDGEAEEEDEEEGEEEEEEEEEDIGDDDYAWFNVAAVDAKVYLYLLQYVVCSELNKEPLKQIAMDKLATITLHDIHNELSHRETAFNLLGWIYLQEHRVADAMWCFLQSWEIRPDHNAAKFHVLIESYRMAEARALHYSNTERRLVLFSDSGRSDLTTTRLIA